MKLEPISELLDYNFDKDSLIYISDDHFVYGEELDESIIKDIKDHTIQIYTGYYIHEKGWKSPKIYLLGRGKNSGKVKLKIQNFKPYCYIKADDGDYKDYLGNKCKQMIFETHPSRIKFYRERRRKSHYPLPYEADILFVRRFLCDVYDYFKPKEKIQPRIAIIDIETDYPVSEDIIAWSINDMEGDIVYRSKFDGLSSKELSLELYNRLLEYDVVTGWNINFDMEELQKQLDRFGTDKYIIANEIAKIDLLIISKKMYAKEIKGNWSLDNVGKNICGLDKIHIGSKQIRDLDEQELLEYNVRDSIIPEIIDNVLGGLEGHLILSWSLQCILDDTTITAVVNDIALLRAYHRAGIVLPSRDYSKDKSKEAKYKAAEPDARPGVYREVIATDLEHAYPSAVIAKNISPETKDPNGVHETPNGIRFNDKHSVFIDTLKEIMIDRGKIKSEMNKLDPKTEEWKKLKSIDFALKTQAAAFSHGIFGWSNSRMKDYEVADSITAVVRDLIDTIKEACDVIGRPWIYAHTDSAYINAPKSEKEKIMNYLNNIIEEHCKGYLITPKLDYKKYYKVTYIHSPARNVMVPEDVGIDDDEEWDVTGMNFMRSETAEPLGRIEIDLIKMLFKKRSKDSILSELKNRIKDLINENSTELGVIKPLNKSISEYGKLKKDGDMGGIPYHIKALKRANREYGYSVNVGEKFMIIPIYTDETEGVRVIRRKKIFMAYDIEKGLPDKYVIDYETYLRSNLWGKINNIFDVSPKELEKCVMTDDVKSALFAGII